MRIDRRITLDGFLRAFRQQDRDQRDQPFCFILGAGASKPSGIRTGGELARQFVEDMHQAENFDSEPLEKWCAADRLGIKDFRLDRVAEFYPQLYQRLFGEHPDRGYAFLEKEMEDREPSYGYSVLAWILANTPHKVVITPNFDNLMADALSIHSATFPRVVGHDSLAGFVQAALRRPLIAKVHGDLGFTPRNTPDEIARLSEEWKTALGRVLERFTPIVIGYGGNDGSLMATLEGLPAKVPDSIYWCQREGEPASDRVMHLLQQRKGHLVVIPGFDELMLKLQDHMRAEWDMPDLLGEMKRRQRDREESYDKQRGEIGARLAAPRPLTRVASNNSGTEAPPTRETGDLAGAAVRVLAPTEGQKPWWQWYQEAAAQPDPEKRDAIYRAGLEALPQSAELLGNYAIFLKSVRNDPDRAEEFYKRAIETDPKDADYLGNYAIFLEEVRKDLDRAEEFYKRAVEADPADAHHLGNYAVFLKNVRKDLDRADEFYRRAIEADPANARNLSNYAIFLKNVRKDPDRAEEFYKRAIETDPKDADYLGNYAIFLEEIRKDPDRAEEFYKRAIETDPKNARNLSNYAVFLKNVRKDLNRADEFYRRAIEADPANARNLSNYAIFLKNVRKDPDRAEEFYKRAIETDPKDADYLGNYAIFLEEIRKDPDRAEEFYKRAVEADPADAHHLGNYALFLKNVRKDLDRADEFYRRAIEADPANARNLTNYANFLGKIRKNPDRAEQFYKRAIEADATDDYALGSYAIFLQSVCKDLEQASQFYSRAVDADPAGATWSGNSAGLLLALNKQEKGFEMLTRAEAALKDEFDLELELIFYRLAHDGTAWPKQIKKLRGLLQKGIRSPDWSLDQNIERAEKNGHPHVELLRALAMVINDQAPLNSLEVFPEWQAAS